MFYWNIQIKDGVTEVALPIREHLLEDELRALLSSDSSSNNVKHLAWLLHTKEGKSSCLCVTPE